MTQHLEGAHDKIAQWLIGFCVSGCRGELVGGDLNVELLGRERSEIWGDDDVLRLTRLGLGEQAIVCVPGGVEDSRVKRTHEDDGHALDADLCPRHFAAQYIRRWPSTSGAS